MTITSSGNIQLPIGNDQTIGQVFSTAHSSGNVGSIGLTISDGGGHAGVFVNNTHDGTYSDQSITFKTAEGGVSSATARMHIDSSGQVGIGTDSPAFTAGSGLRIERDATATLRLQDTGAHGFEIRATSSAAEFFSANAKPFTFETGGSEVMRIDSSGDVLVNCTDSIFTTTQSYISLKGRSGDYATLELDGAGSAQGGEVDFGGGGIRQAAIASLTGSDLAFYTNSTNTGVSVTERMRIDSSGNVGIGTDSPDTLVHLSDATGGAVIRLERQDTGIVATDVYGSIEFEGQDSSSGASGVRGSISGIAESTTGGMGIVFSTAPSGGSNTERMRIDRSGNVGIGRAPTAISNYKVVEAYTNAVNGGIFSAINNTGEFRIVKQSVDGYFNMTDSGSTIFQSNGSERMRIDSSGNVLVGTSNSSGTAGSGVKLTNPTSPADDGKLMIVGATSTSGQDAFLIYSTGASAYRCFINYAGQIYATSTSITAISDESLKGKHP